MSLYKLENLEQAANENRPSVVRELLKRYPSEVDRQFKGITALQLAARKGHLEIMKILIKNGADENDCDINDCTPLHYAVKGDQPDAVALLLQFGAKMNEEDNNEETPPQIAFCNKFNSCVKKFLDVDPEVKLKKKTRVEQVKIPVTLESYQAGNPADKNGESKCETQYKLSLCEFCKKDPALVTYEPCGHKISCIPCSFTNTACLRCAKPIEKASFLEVPETMEYLANIRELKAEIQKLNYQHTCYICRDRKINCVLEGCGHMFCHKCVRNNKNEDRYSHVKQDWICHFCGVPSRYIKIYPDWK